MKIQEALNRVLPRFEVEPPPRIIPYSQLKGIFDPANIIGIYPKTEKCKELIEVLSGKCEKSVLSKPRYDGKEVRISLDFLRQALDLIESFDDNDETSGEVKIRTNGEEQPLCLETLNMCIYIAPRKPMDDHQSDEFAENRAIETKKE